MYVACSYMYVKLVKKKPELWIYELGVATIGCILYTCVLMACTHALLGVDFAHLVSHGIHGHVT